MRTLAPGRTVARQTPHPLFHVPTIKPKRSPLLPNPAGGIVRQQGTAPGVGIQYDPSGAAQRFVHVNDPSKNSQVGLAKGWGIEYDAAGKPIRFVHQGPTGGSASPAVAPTPAPAPTAAAPAGTPDPRDSAYWNAIDALTRDRDTGLATLDHQHDANVLDRDAQIRSLAEALTRDRQSTNETGNKQGLFYSSTLANRLGDVEKDNAERQGGVQSGFARSEQALADQRRALADAFHTGGDTAFGDAVDRRGAIDATEAAPLDPVAAPAPAAAAPAAVRKPYQEVPVKHGVWHVYPNGKRVFVRKP